MPVKTVRLKELIEQYQELDRRREELDHGIRTLRHGDDAWDTVMRDGRFSVQLLAAEMTNIRRRMKELNELEVSYEELPF